MVSVEEAQALSATGQRMRWTEETAIDGPGGSDDPHRELKSAVTNRLLDHRQWVEKEEVWLV